MKIICIFLYTNKRNTQSDHTYCNSENDLIGWKISNKNSTILKEILLKVFSKTTHWINTLLMSEEANCC